MAAGFQLTSIFLLCLLNGADYSSAFPRVSSYTETRQGISEKPQEGYGYGNRRPLQYAQALRQRYREIQAKVQDPDQVVTQQKPQINTIRVHSQAQIQNRPSLFSQTQSQYRGRSDVPTKWPQGRTPPQTDAQPIQYGQKQAPQMPPQHYTQLGPSPINYPLPKPRSFEFNIKLPFANFPAQNKVTGGGTKGSDLVSGGSFDDGSGSDSQSTYRPTSVHIDSSFNRPSSSAGGPVKGSTKDPNGAQNTHDVSKPSFQLSLSVPIPSPTPSVKPSSSNVGFVENLHGPSRAGLLQNSYMESEHRGTGPAQSGFFSNSASTVQREAEQSANGPVQIKPDGERITFSTERANQHNTPTEQSTQANFPTEQSSHRFPKPGMGKYPPPSALPSLYPPPQYENAPSGYYSSQIKPTSMDYGRGQSGQTPLPNPTHAPSQYEKAPSGHYNGGQLKPSGRGQTEPPTFPGSAPPTFAPAQYNYGQFKPSSGEGQNEQHVPQPIHPVPPSSPTFAPSQYEKAPSGHYSVGQLKPSGNNYGRGQTELTTFPGSAPPTVAPAQYNYGQFKPSSGKGQNEQPVPQPIRPVPPPSPTFAPSQYEQPSFGNHNIATSASYHGKGNTGQTAQIDFTKPVNEKPPSPSPSFSPYQYSNGQSGQNYPLIAVDHLPHFQDVPSKYHQTQVPLPTRYTGTGQLDGKPRFTKVVIDAEHESPLHGAVGQHGYFGAPTTHYDGPSGKLTGQNVPEKNIIKHDSMSAGLSEPPSPGAYGPVSVSHPQSTGFEQQRIEHNRPVASSFETYPSNRPESYTLGYSHTPSMDSEDGQYVYNPQMEMEQIRYSDPMPGQTNYGPYLGASDGSVPTYFGQAHIEQGRTSSELTSEPKTDSLGTSQHGQYPGSNLQHTGNYPGSVNMINSSNTSGFNRYNQYPYGNQDSSSKPPPSRFPPPIYQPNPSSNRDFVQVSPINPKPQAPQYTLPTKLSSLQPTQQQSQSVGSVNSPQSAQSTSSNSYVAQLGRPINLKPFGAGYTAVHPKPSSPQHSQQAASAAKPLQSFQPSYQQSASYSGGFSQVSSPVNPKPQASYSVASDGGGYSYGGGYTPSSVHNGYKPSSSPREPIPQSQHTPVSGGYGSLDSGGYKLSSSPRRPMTQDLYSSGYKPSS